MSEVMMAVSFLIEEDDKVLIVEESKPEILGKWDFPGGRVEQDETLKQAVARELMEEVGKKAESTKLIRIYEGIRADGSLGIRFLYKVTLNTQESANKFHSDISANRMVTNEELRKLIDEHKVRPRLFQFIELCDYLKGFSDTVEVIELTDGMSCPCGSGQKWEVCHAE